MALVEVSVVEQRYRAVLEVKAGVPVTEVAARRGVARRPRKPKASLVRAAGVTLLLMRTRALDR